MMHFCREKISGKKDGRNISAKRLDADISTIEFGASVHFLIFNNKNI